MEETITKNETATETTGDVCGSANREMEPIGEHVEPTSDESARAEEMPSDCESPHKLVFDHIELGKRGERAARAFLERHGFDILDTNWECPAGEVDIVVWDGYALRFVEVKTRRGTGKGFPEEAVNTEKRARYERIAEYYLRNFDKVDIPIFFDIIGIVATGEGRAFLRYHRDAFGRDYIQ